MTPFDFQPRTRIVFGPGRIEELGQLAGELGAQRAIMVSDPGVIAAGHTRRGVDALLAAGIDVCVFDEVRENPTTADVERALQVARRHDPELLVGLGGGSAMDCAKGVNFVFSNGGSIKDYWGVGKALQPMLPMIAVPTTAGTGSETQSFALISDEHTKVKMACGDKKASCRVALLDPELTLTQPARITALTGIDALAHAVETFVTTRRNPASLAFSREAWRLLSAGFPRVLEDPQDLQARGDMQLGASFAGLAIENSMLGATHALANPLTARYGMVHGQAIGIMLPHVVEFNGQEHAAWYRDMWLAGVGCQTVEASKAPAAVAELIAGAVRKAGLPTTLSECGVSRDDLDQLAADAEQQWTGKFNPRPVGCAELKGLYERAF